MHPSRVGFQNIQLASTGKPLKRDACAIPGGMEDRSAAWPPSQMAASRPQIRSDLYAAVRLRSGLNFQRPNTSHPTMTRVTPMNTGPGPNW